MEAITFGTSGWRGVLGDEITGARLRALAAATGQWLAARGAAARILVGHDTRALGPWLAQQAAEVLAGCGVRPLRVASPVPTPVVAHAVRAGRAEAALLLTASHNPPAYQGVKVFGPWGGGIERADTRRIERLARRALACGEPPRGRVRGRPLDLVTPYLDQLHGALDRGAFAGTRLHVHYDALHGTGAGVCDRALRELGARVTLHRAAPDPRFGGASPDPTPARLAPLAARLRRGRGLRLGLATDGDADRYAGVDAGGRLLSETEAVALLVDHLARTGRVRRGVAISIATGSLVEQVAAAHGLPVERHPIGFKHLSAALRRGTADVAGEESGGFAWEPLGRDKDGIVAGCLLAEIVASTRAPLRARLRELTRRHGSSACGRAARAVDPVARERLERWIEAPPARVERSPVRAVDRRDGLHLALDDGFLMLRASGTEPVLRVYAEAPDAARLGRRLRAGARLLDAPGATR